MQVWPIIYIDALWVKIRSGSVVSRPVYLAVGVGMDGCKDVLGLWVKAEGESATTWMAVLFKIRNRGIEDVCIVACYRVHFAVHQAISPVVKRI
ncbi:transposase [Streptomyces wuyuanensis]